METAKIVSISSKKKAALINKYVAKQAELAKLKTELELIKIEAIELLGEGTHETNVGKVTIVWAERLIFDQPKAKSLLTPAQLSVCFKPSSFYDVRVKGGVR